ncbi:MAG: SDR family oxidoreductase [Bacteroidota bacterium]|jgi:3-oxoacyl-[acyl-carrier protein] reductase
MNYSLKGMHALVCGSSKGIGKASAITLAAMGAHVTLSARNEVTLVDAMNQLDTSVGQQHAFLIADFSKPVELKEIIRYRLKTQSFQILVNNTGGPAAGTITDANEEQFISAFQNHLLCNHILATTLIDGMKAASYGRIINIISTSVKVPLRGLGVSNTIRAAVASWAKTLSNELAVHGITVNNVLPGATATERLSEIIRHKALRTHTEQAHIEREMLDEIPMNRFANPMEVAAAVGFLASPSASYITGINIPVDGGRTGCL